MATRTDESTPNEAPRAPERRAATRWTGNPLRAAFGWALGLLAAALASGCQDDSSMAAMLPARDPIPVRVEALALERLTDSLVIPGLTEAKMRIELSFRVPGFLEHFAVDEGDRVEAGALLAELDLEDLERALRSARATRARAQAGARVARQQYERQGALMEQRSTSQERHDRARADHDAARSELHAAQVALETAQDRLAKGVLRAPIGGWVERRLIEPHERVAPERPVLVLSDLDPIVVRAALADHQLGHLGLGAMVRVRSRLWPERDFEGVIRRIDVAADASTRTVPFEVEIANPDLALRPSLAVDVEIPVGEPAPVLSVPLAAVLRDARQQPFCFVAAPEGDTLRADPREVEMAGVRGARVVITQGLVEGDRVVTRGHHFLRSGDPLRLLED